MHHYGFLKGRSTSQAVLQLVNTVSDAINNSQYSLGIFLDIQKAFDTVDHQILLDKLENAGVRGTALRWFHSFMAGRSQRVLVGSTLSSDILEILIGVLQGSILGVILFLVFINDICRAAPELLKIFFADDIEGMVTADNMDELIIKANNQIRLILRWYSSNKLSIHPSKSKAILFTPKFDHHADLTFINNSLYLPIFIDLNPSPRPDLVTTDITIIKPIRIIPNEEETAVKSLGILIDENLNFAQQISAVHGKASRAHTMNRNNKIT